MFTGIQILEPRIFSYIPRGVFSHSTTDVYPRAMAAGERIAAHVATGEWYELSTIHRYLDISLAMLRKQGRDLHEGVGCEIAEGADVRDSVFWDRVRVEPGARVHHAVLGDDVHLRRGETIEHAVVVRAALVGAAPAPPKAISGEVRGDNFVARLSQ